MMRPEKTLLSLARRRVLAGGALLGTLAFGGGALFWPRRGAVLPSDAAAWSFLLPADRVALLALAPVFVGAEQWDRHIAGLVDRSESFVRGIDLAIAYLMPRTRDELRQLFDMLASPGGRWILLGSVAAWDAASRPVMANGLVYWREAELALLRTAYEGLRDLVFAVWYGDPLHWPDLSYPGPGDL